MKRRQTDNRMNGQTIPKVKGKLNGVLQTKIWKPGAAKEGSHAYGQQFRQARRSLQNKVWDPGKIEGNVLMTRRSLISYLRSLMQEHPLSKTSSKTKHGGVSSKILERTKFLKRNIVNYNYSKFICERVIRLIRWSMSNRVINEQKNIL